MTGLLPAHVTCMTCQGHYLHAVLLVMGQCAVQLPATVGLLLLRAELVMLWGAVQLCGTEGLLLILAVQGQCA